MATTSRILTGVAGLALVLGACSTAKQVEDEVADKFEEQLGVPAEVDCPSDAKAETGEKFDCTATFGDKDLTVHVEFISDSTFEFSQEGLVATVEDAETEVKRSIENSGTLVDSVDCGTETIVAAPGETFNCTMTSGADTVELIVTASDEPGAFTVEVAP
jgi:hypothetical protein